jgi:gelsolin
LLLDLHGAPIQYREIQGFESPRLLSYFERFTCLKGGVATGFHHVTDESPLDDIRALYRITFLRTAGKSILLVREIPFEISSLVAGDVYILDLGRKVLQFQSKGSSPQEKFKAAGFVQQLIESRKGQSQLVVCGKTLPI